MLHIALRASRPAILAAALLAAAGASQAQVQFGTSGGFVTFTVTSPITFTATDTESNFTRIVFEDAYATSQSSAFFDVQSNSIGLLRNGAPIAGLATSSLWGPFSSTLGLIDPTDWTISFVGTTGIAVGDTVTLTPGTAVTNVPSGLLPTLFPLTATLTGNSGNGISAPVALVPEPQTWLLMALGLAGIARVAARHRQG